MNASITSSSTGSPGAPSSSTETGRARRTGGFTLLEVLVAMVILAVALVSLIQAFSTGLRGLGTAQANSFLVTQARSTLETVGSLTPLEDGSQSGEFDDGTLWSVEIQPYDAEDAADFEILNVTPYEVEVTVTSKSGRRITLQSLRLGPKE